ncbi:cytochrome d ubiquinol oxidase subunit II [Thermosulfuriphilus ammonigenes]|uniref:Cytochrome d ubiquinol oxidase subunit II n=1 Tax=Thermosulfuriphilus ammonigenes TaxID=1936021 RepID=A0A6G7PZ01_9BACT|nr:cytochrome d ubiquinol oxidase subunit II [Thermosulfuriphilus ammonigenes]MBA2849067.1 cytochrome d ubiquinol oxidase subunit II [Thermosulfuriphilus ammonigenes]QIJ72751.1 cytochrome d ubiquinol oxidase subunit II [Thermosulfuriphilus ammonigenes]
MFETIWFILWGVLWAVYFMLDGFDLGLGSLMPVVAKNDTERRIVYNTMGPFWDGNEVWLITAGGATFAAFPKAYAVMFSGLYTALLLLLFALIVRGVAFEFRGKVDSPGWRSLWDFCLVIGSFIPALLLGVAFANIFKGLPIDKEGIFHGGLLTLLNPYGLLGGVLFVMLFLVHGSLWLAAKSNGELSRRGASLAARLWPLELIIAAVFLVATWFATDLYDNYLRYPILFVIPALAVVGLVLIRVFLSKEAYWKAWFASCLTIVSATFFGLGGLYPRLLPSSLTPEASLTIYNASSSPLTLKIMTGVALVFVPIVIAYQAWTYNLFKEKVREEDLSYEEAY